MTNQNDHRSNGSFFTMGDFFGHFRLSFMLNVLVLSSCVTTENSVDIPSQASSSLHPPVSQLTDQAHQPAGSAANNTQGFLPASLSKDFFRNAVPELDNTTFEDRWNHSLKSPLIFLRSHVRAYYLLLGEIVRPNWPVGICLGDAHPDNFGFMAFGKSRVAYVANDFDDSDLCPVILDALRYFSAVRLVETPENVASLLQEYMEVLQGKRAAKTLEPSFYPSLKKKRKKTVKKLIHEGLFSEQPDLSSTNADTAAQIIKKVNGILERQKSPRAVLDLKQANGLGGGSRGLLRYWIALGSRKKGRAKEIAELKQLASPAVAVGNWGSLGTQRINRVTQSVWPDENLPYLFETLEMNGSLFLLRSRAKESLSLDTLSASERLEALKVQVGILANLHAKSFEKSNPPVDLEAGRAWLQSTSLELSQAYMGWVREFSR